MGGVFRYIFVFAVVAFILFFFFKTMKETKIYQSKRWRRKVKNALLLIAASVLTTILLLGTYIYFAEGIH